MRVAIDSSGRGNKRGEGEEESSEVSLFELHRDFVATVSFRAP